MYQLLSLHGQNKDALAKSKAGAWEYDIIGPWYKCNMTDIMAAIGLRQLDRYYPKQKVYYRCINKKVDLEFDYLNDKVIPYEKVFIKLSMVLHLLLQKKRRIIQLIIKK